MAAQSPSGAPDQEALEGFFERYMADPANEIPDAINPLKERLDAHLGADSSELQSLTFPYRRFLQVAYQRALDEFLAEPGREHEIVGIRCPSIPDYQMGGMALSWLLSRPTFAFVPPVFCPPDFAMIPSGYRQAEACLTLGLVLFRDSDGPGVLWIHVNEWNSTGGLEIMTASPERSEKILDRLEGSAMKNSPYSGKVVQVERSVYGPVITFLERPRTTTREDVILPDGVLDQIERHTLGVNRARQALRNSGRPTKRGILLHGRPGTGKTHTIKYLIGQMPDATIAIMSAGRMQHLYGLTDVIDVIMPGVIVLDDVDMIAEDRELAGSRGMLFALLDILDGISDLDDLLFVMTTNRPNEIEPAVVSRPGRVDQAIEVPLPDASCRRRLFEVYCDGLDVQMTDAERDRFLERTEGVTASFIREVLRRATVAALRAGDTNQAIKVSGEQVHAALDQLLDPANPLTPLLLGAVPKHALPTAVVSSMPSPA